jgi:hypothetical protein
MSDLWDEEWACTACGCGESRFSTIRLRTVAHVEYIWHANSQHSQGQRGSIWWSFSVKFGRDLINGKFDHRDLLVSMAISDPNFGLFGVEPGRLRGYPLAHLADTWRRSTPHHPDAVPTDFNGFLWLSRPPPKSRDSGTGHSGPNQGPPLRPPERQTAPVAIDKAPGLPKKGPRLDPAV